MKAPSSQRPDGLRYEVPPPVILQKLAYSIPEAMEVTGLGRTFLYDQMSIGALKSRKLGGRRVILREDLVEFLNSSAPGEGLTTY
ncbi:helix-turn-helix domain-containing protein [Asticcacaulis sp. AND118]|uniref:helix-turn-helix domain-containing protein n=1 Tax=Asticcacaulis sp. AND118 TaxID=2840468 RepID=UPI001CFF731D|nr:helix-turn-helix domain-containing protein [Asticcacaulis sp. AND118]UDF04855.1 helix-turn-helix domain-containing protein [Asticcacaulis sp. AND118]